MPPTLLWENTERKEEEKEGGVPIADTAAEIASLLLVRNIKKRNEVRGRQEEMLRWG